jgi:hypothetical protein
MHLIVDLSRGVCCTIDFCLPDIMGRAKILLDQFKADESIIPYASADPNVADASGAAQYRASAAPSKDALKAQRNAEFQGQWSGQPKLRSG